jgi:uncharacterized protein
MIAVHVAQLLKAPVGTTRAYEFSEAEPALEEELGLRGPVEGRARLVRTSYGVLAECSYRVEIDQECGRCLGAARTVVESRFSQEYLPSTDIYTGLPEEILADPDEPRIGPDHILDLTEAIRQDIVLQLPLQPRCREDCAGLCPHCGRNLNEGRCEHEGAEEAGALGRLGELLKRELGS